MKIIYVIYYDWNEEQKQALSNAGIPFENGFSRIEVVENDKNKSILSQIEQWGIRKSVGTIYDKKDLDKSLLFVFNGAWENGYPQPEDDFGYMNITYNLRNYCKECGIGAVQNAPFQIKKLPQWGKKIMFELNWVLDEIFVSKESYEDIFVKYGINKRPVLQYKKGVELNNAYQLDIPFVNIPLDMKDHQYEVCKICGRKKYNPQIKGYFQGFKKVIPNLPIIKSMEYFGSGGRAFNRIFIVKELFDEIKKRGMRINVAPVDPSLTIIN